MSAPEGGHHTGQVPQFRVVDLSHPIHDATPVYPGDPSVHLTPAARYEINGFNVLHVRMGSQTGTHLDAPFHLFPEGARVDQLDLGTLCGPAVIVDARGTPARSPIARSVLGPALEQVQPGTIVVLHTGWSAHWGTPRYHDHPYLGGAEAAEFVAHGVRTIGIDALSLDETTPAQPHPSDYAAHRAVLGAGGAIAENLRNLDAVGHPDPVLSLLPLPLRGADGAPVRAVALLPD